jgi:hypothetical protein
VKTLEETIDQIEIFHLSFHQQQIDNQNWICEQNPRNGRNAGASPAKIRQEAVWRCRGENAHSVLVGRSVAARIHAKGLKALEPVTKRGRMESGMLSSLVLSLRLASRRCGDCGGVTTADAVDLVCFPASAKEK